MKKPILGLIAILSLVPFAHAAQLDAALLYGQEKTQPSFEFLRVVYIEYPEGGLIAESLRGEKKEIFFEADSTTPGMSEFISNLNENLKSIPSNAVISDVKVHYQAIIQGNENKAVIEYRLELTPTIENHILFKELERSSIDINWRGISLHTPVLIETDYGQIDINNPKSSLTIMIPDMAQNLDVSILELPLIDATGIKDLPIHRWHSLFDNTAIIPGAKEYKYTGEYVITHYSMGECTVFIGTCDDREWIEEFTLDKNYIVRIIESRDDATIAIEGYADSTVMDGVEVFQTNLKNSINQTPDSDEFLSTIMYGMAGIAAIGAVAMLVMSDKKLKKEQNQGQTGIDPAQLSVYETSISSGGYRTNRGESYLVSKKVSKSAI